MAESGRVSKDMLSENEQGSGEGRSEGRKKRKERNREAELLNSFLRQSLQDLITA